MDPSSRRVLLAFGLFCASALPHCSGDSGTGGSGGPGGDDPGEPGEGTGGDEGGETGGTQGEGTGGKKGTSLGGAGTGGDENMSMGGEGGEVSSTPCAAGCSDENPCNGIETCNEESGLCQPGTPLCDDGVDCTVDDCDPNNGECSFVPDDALCSGDSFCSTSSEGCVVVDCKTNEDCDDGIYCNGQESCSEETLTCSSGTIVDCDDSTDCSVDTCVEGTASYDCVHTPPDLDRDGYGDASCEGDFDEKPADCDDQNEHINPDQVDLCNGIDENCSGAADEGYEVGADCGMGQGQCLATGELICDPNDSGKVICDITDEPAITNELCDGLDNDCDGQTDESVVQACYSGPAPTNGVGVCHGGTQTCTNAVFGSCQGQVTPSTETCNALDDDCDGQTDEATSLSCYTGPAGTSGVGLCEEGKQTCTGGVYGACSGQVLPQSESCNNADDDCDGQVDEAVVQACYTGPGGTNGIGACKGGQQTCTAGVFGAACVGQVVPETEVCNDIDDDCDGQLDEGCDDDGDDYCDFNFTTVGTPAVCPNGGSDCNDNTAAQSPGNDELCGDSTDNDCSGTADVECNVAFVTSAAYFPGVAGATGITSRSDAHATCQQVAEAAGETGSFKAWIADGATAAGADFGSARGWVRPDGRPIADTVADITAGRIWYPIRLTQSGSDTGATLSQVWTGSGGNHCANWTLAGSGTYSGTGIRGAGSSDAIRNTLGACNTSLPLYCFQTDHQTPAVIPTPNSGYKRAFVSSASLSPGTGLAGADAVCAQDATSAGLSGTYLAMLGTSTASAASRFVSGGLGFRRPDGVVLSSTRASFFDGTLWRAPMNQLASGSTSYVSAVSVWSGTSSPLDAGPQSNTCASWNSSSSGASGRYGLASHSSTSAYELGTQACNVSARLYCLEQ